MIKAIKKFFNMSPFYIYFIKFDNKYYGLCGVTVQLTRIDISTPQYMYEIHESFYDHNTLITRKCYDKFIAENNYVIKEILDNDASMKFLGTEL